MGGKRESGLSTPMIFQCDLYLTGPDPQRASTTYGCHVHGHIYKAPNEKL